MLRLIAENWEGITGLVCGKIRTIRVRPSLKVLTGISRPIAQLYNSVFPPANRARF